MYSKNWPPRPWVQEEEGIEQSLVNYVWGPSSFLSGLQIFKKLEIKKEKGNKIAVFIFRVIPLKSQIQWSFKDTDISATLLLFTFSWH